MIHPFISIHLFISGSLAHITQIQLKIKYTHTHKQTNKQTSKQTNKQTNKQTRKLGVSLMGIIDLQRVFERLWVTPDLTTCRRSVSVGPQIDCRRGDSLRIWLLDSTFCFDLIDIHLTPTIKGGPATCSTSLYALYCRRFLPRQRVQPASQCVDVVVQF